MSDKRDDGYGGTLARKCEEQMIREGKLTYPHLTAMSTDDLTTMLRCVSEYPEDADFAKAIVEEIKHRKPLTSMPNERR